jgi:PAS domain S-box-containing protein
MKFRTKTILGIALIEVLFLAAILWTVVDGLRDSEAAQIDHHAATTGRLLLNSAKDALVSQDLPMLDALAKSLVDSHDVLYVRFRDPRGQVISGAGAQPPEPHHPDIRIADVTDGVLDHGETLTIAGQTLGSVEFGIDVSSLDRSVVTSARRGIFVGVVEILLAGLFSWALGSYLTRQLDELRDAGLRLAKGELSHRVPIHGKDELAQTALAFNTMAERMAEVVSALAEREATLRDYADASIDWYWETDAEHRFSWVSGNYERTTGLAPSWIIGKRRWDLASEDEEIDASLWQNHIETLAAHRKFRDFRYWPAAGRYGRRWISVSGTPRYDNAGVFVGYRGSGTDVTDAAEAALRTRLLSQVVEHCPATVVVTDPQGNIEYVNERFVQITGFSREEAFGQNPRIIASGETPAAVYVDMWATLTAGKPWTGELKNRRRTGEFFWENIAISPIRDDHGAIAHYIGIKEEITYRKEAAERQEAANRQLAEQAAELARSNAELEQFSYVVSHDLRQPLRMVSSYVTLLERHLKGKLDEDAQEFITFARDGAQRMDRLIVDILDYSRIGRKAQPFKLIKLDEIVAEALLNLQFTAEEAAATITVQPGLPEVMGEQSEMVRLFQNLIGNSLKYRDPERAPVIFVSGVRAEGEWRLSVEDNGIGFAPEHGDRIFGVFQRLHTQDQYEGTGIGLAICRRIVERHGGRIWAESAPGKGTRFTFSLPALSAPPKAGQRAEVAN